MEDDVIQRSEKSDGLTPRVKAPLQDRSRETLERIIKATREIMDGRDYETISVQEICGRAEVSTSSFYARFANKEALLLSVHEAHRAERAARLSRYVTDVNWDELSMIEVVRACLKLYVEDRRKLDPLLRSLMLAEMRFPKIAAERATVDASGVDIIRNRLMKIIGADRPGMSEKIEFAIRVVCTAAQEAIRPPSQFADCMNLSDQALVDELSLMFCRYVGLPTTDSAGEVTRGTFGDEREPSLRTVQLGDGGSSLSDRTRASKAL